MLNYKLIYILRITLILIILTGCSSSLPLPIISPVPTKLASLEPSDCGSDLPPDVKVTCGNLVVPEDRTNPSGKEIRMAVMIFKNQSQNPKPDPVLFIFGGPMPNLNFAFGIWYMFQNIRSDRDLIVFDQRGVGNSQPNLDCPEVSDWFSTSLSEDTRSPQYGDSLVGAHRACHDRLAQSGINLSAYTSAATIADLKDLRVALGYSAWNIYSLGYGARLALQLMREDPGGIRSVILDSVMPPQVDIVAEQAFNAEQVLNLMFKYCADDEKCNSPYPNLRSTFYDVVDQLNAHPVSLEVSDQNAGRRYSILVNGDRFINVVLGSVGSSFDPSISQLPRMISQTRANKYDVLKELLAANIPNNEPGSTGMQSEILCSEDYHFTTLEKVITANSRVDPGLGEFFNNDAKNQFAVCEIWTGTNITYYKKEAIESSIPALLQAGEFDWFNPPSWSKLAVTSLSNSYYVEYKYVSNVIFATQSFGDCSHQIMEKFLADPHIQPEIACSKEKKSILWITIP